jgi:hypothetical protein
MAEAQETLMNSTTRRIFFIQLAGVGSALAAATAASAATAAKDAKAPAAAASGPATVDEKDPQAAALGYVADSTKADAKKYPKHAATQKCGNCQLYGGKAGDAAGPCPIFAGKQVAAAGWCSSWMKKPA